MDFIIITIRNFVDMPLSNYLIASFAFCSLFFIIYSFFGRSE